MLEPLAALRGLKQVHIEYRPGLDLLCPRYIRNLAGIMRSDMPKRDVAMGPILYMDEVVLVGGEDEKEVGEMRRMKGVCGVGVGEV